VIVDASVILEAFFPDDEQEHAQALMRDHVMGRCRLEAPDLLVYEVTNAVVQARRRGRIDAQQAEEILTSFEGLGIALMPVGWQQMLPVALTYDRSAYDAAYLALAEATEQPLISGDLRLYRAVHERCTSVLWIGEYPTAD